MTQDEWESCSDPQVMLAFLHDSGKLTERKARLSAVAVCRRIWPLLTDERSRRAVEVTERFADGLAEEKEIDHIHTEAQRACWEVKTTSNTTPHDDAAHAVFWASARLGGLFDSAGRPHAGVAAAHEAATNTAKYAAKTAARTIGWQAERVNLCDLLRCISGNPFRTSLLDASLLNKGIVILAQTIYEQRSFNRLPKLAQALADAGCTDADLLGHMRGPGPHAKGCWVIDAILGRK